MKNTIDFYDDTAQSWADRWYKIETFLPYLKRFLSFFPFSPRIAELCCGTGYDTKRLHDLGADVIGLDLSQKALNIARQKNPRIKFYYQDILMDYSYIGLVDGVLCCAGLIHLDNEELVIAFRNMNKVLKKGGYLFFVVYDGEGRRYDWQYITIDGITYDRVFYKHTKKELCKAAEGLFEFVREFEHETDDRWRYYLFQK